MEKNHNRRFDRRTFAKTVGGSLAGLSMAGCQAITGGGGGGSETLTFWHFASGRHAEAQKQVASNFEEQSDHSVDVQVWGDADNYHSTLLNSLGTDQAPDSFGNTAINKFGQVVEAGNVLKASEYLQDDIKSMYTDNMLNTVRYADSQIQGWNDPDGTLYGMPDNVSIIVMWYNKNVLEEAGVDLERVHHAGDVSWSEFVSMLEEVDANTDKTPMAMSSGSWQTRLQVCCHLSKAMGVSDYVSAGLGLGGSFEDSDPAANALGNLQDVIDDGLINDDHSAIDHRTAVGYLAKDDAAFHAQGTWIGALLDAAAPEDFAGIPDAVDYMWFPYYEDINADGQGIRNGLANWSLGMSNQVSNRSDSHQQAAYDWFNYRNSKEAWKTVFNTSERLAPVELDINTDDISGLQQTQLDMQAQLEEASNLSPYDVALLPRAFDFMVNEASSLISTRWTAEKWLTELQAAVDAES